LDGVTGFFASSDMAASGGLELIWKRSDGR
jgi:hypothetical protein